MTSTPIHHPDGDDPHTQAEDQGSKRSQGRTGEDLVDEETKKLSQEEAETHDDAEEAQKADAEESGGYGH